jgi:uncharacterized membrane protein YqjE
MSDGKANSGLFSALKGIAATLLATGRTRLELLANEIEEEKLRAIQLLIVAQGMMFCFGVGALLAVGLLSVLWWDSRILVLGLSSAFFFGLGVFFYTQFKRSTKRPEGVFQASIDELEEDLRKLRAAAEND